MLIGEYEHSLDAKGRLIMPAKLREDMGEKFILTTGLDGCLFGFSMSEWEKFEDKLKALPITNKNARNFVRFFLSGATECEIDKQGRFLIPNNLRIAANLEKEAKINYEILKGTKTYVYENMEAYTPYFKLGVEEFNDQQLGATLETQEDGTLNHVFTICLLYTSDAADE